MTDNDDKLKVLTFARYYLPGYKGGGPIKTIKNLSEQVADDLVFKLVTSDRDLGDASPYTSITRGAWNRINKTSVFYTEPGKTGYVQIARQLFAKSYDLVYLNSFFSVRFSFVPLLLAKALRQRVVLGPRGEFSKGALSIKFGRKWAFIKAFKVLGLHRRTVFQASSNYEAEDIRHALGENVDVQVAGNIASQKFAEHLPPRNIGPIKAVFVSRISPKKNLLGALRTLQLLQQPLVYDIYGPIQDEAYWQECERVITSLPSHINVQYKGALNSDDVVQTLEKYDVFLFPTKGENYGHVIAEAFCAGLPVLIADTTPWRNLQEQGIGWDLPLSNPDAFSVVLDELAGMPAVEYLQMRQRVLTWAKNKFSQRDSVEANIALFKYAYEKK